MWVVPRGHKSNKFGGVGLPQCGGLSACSKAWFYDAVTNILNQPLKDILSAHVVPAD